MTEALYDSTVQRIIPDLIDEMVKGAGGVIIIDEIYQLDLKRRDFYTIQKQE